MGVPSLVDVFKESNYAHMPGGILESFGRMFKNELSSTSTRCCATARW